MKKVTILVPCHNEEESLPLLYETVTGLMDNEPPGACRERRSPAASG